MNIGSTVFRNHPVANICQEDRHISVLHHVRRVPGVNIDDWAHGNG